MKILVVGGAGFIGGHLCEALSKAGHDVAVYDLKLGNDARDLRHLWTHVQEHGDIVVHLAANADIARAATDPDIDFEQGTRITRTVLEAMREAGSKHLIYASGSGVYGEYRGRSFREEDQIRPISPYGASKAASEAMIRAYCHMFGMRADVFRFANVVGPRQTHGVGYDFIRKLKATTDHLWILGDGSQRKSYIHVDDVIAAIRLVMDKPRDGFDVWNVSTDDTLSVTDIAILATNLMGAARAHNGNFLYTGGDRGWKGDVPILRMDTSKIEELGWKQTRGSMAAMMDALKAMKDEVCQG